MKKLLLALTLIMSAQITLANSPFTVTESPILKTKSGIYYKYTTFKYKVGAYNRYGTKIKRSLECFIGFPSDPSVNGSQDYLALENPSNATTLSKSHERFCNRYIAFNYNAANAKSK